MNIGNLSQEDLIQYIKIKKEAYGDTVAKMKTGIAYYNNMHDILNKKRLAVGEGGALMELTNLPNSQILDNKYAELVDQKVNYLFGQRPAVDSKDSAYADMLERMLDNRFLRTLNKIALDVYNCGIAWLYVYVEDSELKYKKIDSTEIVPVWSNNNHESLDGVIRTYAVETIKEGKLAIEEYIELYTDKEIFRFAKDKDSLKLIDRIPYISKNGETAYTWNKLPFVYFKNSKEESLLQRVKSLQDAINTILSNFSDNMLEDKYNTVIVLKNYDGENLSDFRSKLASFGAVKVSDDGNVDTLQVEVNSENYKAILEILKEKLIENGRGIARNQKSTNSPNQMDIKGMYSSIELDANALELEFTASFEYFEWFIKKVYGFGGDSKADINLKRNIMVNEAELVTMCRDSVGTVSVKTLLSNHPFVEDVQAELDQLDKEEQKKMDAYYNPLPEAQELIAGVE